ncbi:hypothetical protein SAMN02745911_0830 [Aureimonas altamirensis DSM 21988]|uniref:Uncharacterized protein n=1 Tax=Aureimonas altamirensis DSM 21988 TaxID=1121026 RepID=A0ABY1I6G1_9HYPH|nr:hypothetical protein SAMN02745911_0830 [Aureimonas altamirensis DSM 21988]
MSAAYCSKRQSQELFAPGPEPLAFWAGAFQSRYLLTRRLGCNLQMAKALHDCLWLT